MEDSKSYVWFIRGIGQVNNIIEKGKKLADRGGTHYMDYFPIFYTASDVQCSFLFLNNMLDKHSLESGPKRSEPCFLSIGTGKNNDKVSIQYRECEFW